MLDDKVKELKIVVDKKTKELGIEPKADYCTNLKYGDVNLLTCSLDKLVELLADVLYKEEKLSEASALMEVDNYKNTVTPYKLDIILRGKILNYKARKVQLQSLQKKLDDLRSEDLRKQDELGSLEDLLKGL